MSQRENSQRPRSQAEKLRRDLMNQYVAELAKVVPPVLAMRRKVDKTRVMRLTAHYMRSHEHVFGAALDRTDQRFHGNMARSLLSLFKGFLLTVTYKGIVVVVSENVQQYLGYTELDLIGSNVFAIVHKEDHSTLREQLLPRPCLLGTRGELIVPDEPDAEERVAELLSREKRDFVIRFRKLCHRSEIPQYVTCHVDGFLRKADRVRRGSGRSSRGARAERGGQSGRRARCRPENLLPSGNDVVFVGVVRPVAPGYLSEGIMDSFRMEYRTRHSVDGEIIECEQRIAVVTGYLTEEVRGVNAMNFMHRDDVNWVIVALREMYDQQRIFGESCYRLLAKNGKFVYMRTRGRLEVDDATKTVTSFVCSNTMVGEEEGRYFLDQMRKRYNILVNSGAFDDGAREEQNDERANLQSVSAAIEVNSAISIQKASSW